MKTGMIIALAVMVSTPTPKENYFAGVSPGIAEVILHCMERGDYYRHLDFNGDGSLNIADYYSVLRRYNDNLKYGNEITLDTETILDIAWENYSYGIDRALFISDDLLYYEIEKVNDEACRMYEVTVTEKSEAVIRYEFKDYADTVIVSIDPITETIQVQ